MEVDGEEHAEGLEQKYRPRRPVAPVDANSMNSDDDNTSNDMVPPNLPADDLDNLTGATRSPTETPPPLPSQPSLGHKNHGYTTVEVFPGAARVTRWEYVDEAPEPTPEEVRCHQRMFRLGEWLSKQPLSDQARAEYFDIERVS